MKKLDINNEDCLVEYTTSNPKLVVVTIDFEKSNDKEKLKNLLEMLKSFCDNVVIMPKEVRPEIVHDKDEAIEALDAAIGELNKMKLKLNPKAVITDFNKYSEQWQEFRDTGLLWWVNMILHTFGYAICAIPDDDGKAVYAFPEKVDFRGFSVDSNSKGYAKVTKYLANNMIDLLKAVETEEDNNDGTE